MVRPIATGLKCVDCEKEYLISDCRTKYDNSDRCQTCMKIIYCEVFYKGAGLKINTSIGDFLGVLSGIQGKHEKYGEYAIFTLGKKSHEKLKKLYPNYKDAIIFKHDPYWVKIIHDKEPYPEYRVDYN